MSSTPADRSTTTRAMWCGAAVGGVQAGLAFSFWWLDPATVHTLMIVLIAAVFSDGRAHVIAVESAVVVGFFIAAATAVTLTPWILVAIYLAHGGKDLWQHRHQFVRGTRWWPPFCFAVDVVVAGIVTTQILCGVRFHS